MLDEGRYGTVTELAAGERLDRGYLGKILMLTLLAPDIVEAILDGRQSAELRVQVLRQGFSVEWGEQRGNLGGWIENRAGVLDRRRFSCHEGPLENTPSLCFLPFSSSRGG